MNRLLLSLLVFIAQPVFTQTVFVPLDHQVYPLLVKGETLGLFESYRMRTLPLTRTEVLEMLTSMDRAREKLSRADADLLGQMLGEFTDPAIGEPAPQGSERHLYRFEEGRTQMFLDVRGIQEVQLHRGRAGLEDESILETIGIGSLRASIGKHVFIAANATASMRIGSIDREQRFDPTEGPIQVAVDGAVFSDQATGYAAFVFDGFRLFAGRMQHGWGSGLDDQLGLSVRNEPMDMLKFTLDYRSVRFSYFHATLQSIGLDRYLVGHRLDIGISKHAQIGVYETVVYARRGIQLAYLNPFVPYHFIEHQLGDLDNNTIGIDITTFPWPGVRVVGELFIDDLNWTRPIFRHFGNKLAYHAGIHWGAPLGWKEAELRASYTRVDPWVYTHGDSLNVYVHYGESIGSRLGPNADRYQVSLSLRLHRSWWSELTYQHVRRARGSIFTPHRPADGTEKRFLEGTLERQNVVSVFLRYQFFRDGFVGLEGALRGRNNANLRPGIQADEKFLRLFIDINY